MFKKDNLLDRARRIDIGIILSHYNIYPSNSYSQYNCLNFSHDDTKPSASINPYTNKLKCFGCGEVYSTIDIVKMHENISDLRECAKRVLEISNEEFIPNRGNSCECVTSIKKQKEKKGLSIEDRKNMIVNSKINVLEDYLISRGINPKVVLPILRKNNIVFGADRLEQPTFIFSKFGCCIYRHKEKDENWVTGNNVPITIVSDKESKDWYIVEGLYDALTIVNLRKNVICLNTINNLGAFTDKILINKEKMKKFNYIIALDNDDVGKIAKSKLEDFFSSNNIDYEVFESLYLSTCKDINEMRKRCLI